MGLFSKKKKEAFVLSPVNGKCIALEDVKDEVFSSKMMGDGVAFEIADDTVYSPVAGTLNMVADTKHAVGITTKEGLEILIHVGLETVALGGKGLEALCAANDEISVGTPLIKIDRQIMGDNNIDLTIPMVFLNGDEYTITLQGVGQNVSQGKETIASYK